jgi:two-component system, OmpR family, alkaline phosphatase synthesis response regulator PhoP
VGKQILLVDDYPDALDIWGLYLRSLGYDVITAENGLDAVDLAHREHPDAIVLDLDHSIPLIAATGYSHARQLDHARDCGFDAIIVKPCDPAVLAAEIERAIEAAELRIYRSRVEVPVERLSQNR